MEPQQFNPAGLADPEQTRRKVIVIAAGGVIAFFLLLFIFASTVTKGSVTVRSSPIDATLTLDGKSFKTGTYKMGKGKHAFAAKRAHFKDLHLTVDTGKLIGTKTVYLLMEPSDDEGKLYLETHEAEQSLREQSSGNDFSNAQATLLDKYPIVSKLPHETADYKVDYEVTDGKMVFKITTYVLTALPGTSTYTTQLNADRKAALEYLRSMGVNPDKETIQYSEVSNQQSQESQPSAQELENRQ